MYDFDGLKSVHNSSFMTDPGFDDAYTYTKGLLGHDYNWMWRNYIGISLASSARHNSLNFVECGVGEGWMTISMLRYFGQTFNMTPTMTLFDTWDGIDESVVDPQEVEYWGCSVEERKKLYVYESTEFFKTKERITATARHSDRIEFVRGSIPATLTPETIARVASKGPIGFLHIDMNNSVPEVAAMQAFFPLVTIGGIVLLDDYAYSGYEFQKNKIDIFCDSIGRDHPIALPTGQGLLVKTH